MKNDDRISNDRITFKGEKLLSKVILQKEELINNEKIEDSLSEFVLLLHSFSSVRRFSNKKLLSEENIAEHSALVGVIVTYLMDKIEENEKEFIDLNKVLAFSIFHDIDEIFSGDILNPVKYFKPEIKEGIDEYVKVCVDAFASDSDFESFKVFTNPNYLNNIEKVILKLADVLSVYFKFKIENGLGNNLLNIDYNNVISSIESLPIDKLFTSKRLTDLIHVIKIDCKRQASHNSNFSNILKRRHI